MSGDRRLPADLLPRIGVAVPAAAVTVALLLIGSGTFAALLCVLGALAAVEALRLLPAARPAGAAVLLGVPALVAVAALAGRDGLIPALVVAFALAALLAARRSPAGEGVAATGAALVLIAWLGAGLAHGALIRDLPHGDELVLDVLLATFVGDTAAQLVGTAWGRRRLAPRISPAKTVEGALAGFTVGTATVWLTAVISQEWLGGWQALALGATAAAAAPAGDLFESLLKREAGVKDSGGLFGPHGGALDRIDAVIAAAVAAYYVALALP